MDFSGTARTLVDLAMAIRTESLQEAARTGEDEWIVDPSEALFMASEILHADVNRLNDERLEMTEQDFE